MMGEVKQNGKVLESTFGVYVINIPGSGAAGGMGAGYRIITLDMENANKFI